MKIIGYIIAVIGVIILTASTIPQVKDFLLKSLNLPAQQVSDNFLMIAGITIAIIGIFIVTKLSKKGKKSMKAGQEVPIYHGNQIVGYRRH